MGAIGIEGNPPGESLPGGSCMKCDCRDSIAVVHLRRIVHHKKTEEHLCQPCAQQRGGSEPGDSLSEQLKKLVIARSRLNPEALCEFLIRKHSRPGDLVFDAYGCTGAMSIASIYCDRRWLYAESNPENFGLGEQRIAERLAEMTAAAC